ncbi:MAG: hypothetical protein JWO36_3164 [Myxococcales bacterium]|nr:hypothetical protein [Myxococcales bacterium]
MRAVVLVACLASVSCQSRSSDAPAKQPPKPVPVRPAPASAVDPWTVKTVDAGVETPESRKQHAETALARVHGLEPKLAELRGLAFKQDVPTEYQTTHEFQVYVHREVAKDLPDAKTKEMTAALVQIGLLAKPIDLAAMEEHAMVTQAAAYYDPAAKKFFLVAVPDSDLLLDTISVHELDHGLQDQYFDLRKFLPEGKLDDDQATARRFIAEGEATYTMLMFMARASGGPGAVLVDKLIRRQIETWAAMDLRALVQMSKDQAGMMKSLGPDLAKSVEAMDDIPPTISAPLFYAYMKGALVAMTAYERGGWDAVNALFKDPPESTEQVLHPATKLYPREMPHKVTLPKLGTELTTNVMGELQWWVYFNLWKPKLADTASAGWGGDRFAVIKRKDGKLTGLLATIWDTPQDAKEMYDAYLATLPVRFPGAKPASGAERGDGTKVFVKLDGSKVFIVDGADSEATLNDLVRGAKLD